MTITQEQLDLAALAAGIRPDRSRKSGAPSGFDGFDITGALVTDWHNGVTWRPHLDDWDAARLAVRLSVMMDADQSGYCHAIHGLVDTISIAHDGTEPDKLRAWREAAVLCAAAVGERMQLAKRTNATPEQVAWSLAAVDEYDAAKRGER